MEKKLKVPAIIIVVIIVILSIMMAIDFIKFKNNKEPIFCIEKKIYDYSDGYVKECKGLIYKIYKYDRIALKGKAFLPFWGKMENPGTVSNPNVYDIHQNFKGESEHFAFKTGKAEFYGSTKELEIDGKMTNVERNLIIKDFIQKKEINNLDKVTIILSFNNKIQYTDEYNASSNTDVKYSEYLKNIEITKYGIPNTTVVGEKEPFLATDRYKFMLNIQMTIRYCTTDNKCEEENLIITDK